MIPNIEDLTEPPIVGKFYMVPCVEVVIDGFGWRKGFWPIVGPSHADEKHLDFAPQHWHFDGRFLTGDQYADITSENTRPTGIFSRVFCTSTSWAPKVPLTGWHGPLRVRRRCARAQPTYPTRGLPQMFPAFVEAYTDKKVTCGKCPHRGLPLLSLPREPGTEIVTCPGHGLKWDLKTGALVRPCP